MSNSKDSGGVGIGFCGLLAIVFITLKLCGVITWSWLWVLSPLWIPLALSLLIFGLFMLFAFIIAFIGAVSISLAAAKDNDDEQF